MLNQSQKISLSTFAWFGLAILLLAYALVSFNMLAPAGAPYQVLNVVGSLGIALEALYKKDNPAAFLNIAWVAIGLIVLITIFTL